MMKIAALALVGTASAMVDHQAARQAMVDESFLKRFWIPHSRRTMLYHACAEPAQPWQWLQLDLQL
eukprot:SAG22_NODE_620_length_8513_cov_3.934870_1_plen_66_part_00